MKNSKWFKRLIYILACLAFIHLVLWATGNLHFYRAMRYTIFEGRLGPSIDQYTIYNNREVKPLAPQQWELAPNYNQLSLEQNEEAIHKKFETVAFAVIKDNKLLFEKYYEGYSDTSHTNSWSMAKSIVSVLIGCAIREGKIKSVDEPVEKYLPHLAGSGITIRHLLAMSSGINFTEQYMNPFGFAAKALYGQNNEELVKKYKPVKKPMQIFDYESGNTLLLSYIVRNATGQNLSSYATEKLWRPIGAVHPAFWSLDSKNGNEKAFCCFNSNVRDFAKLGQLYLQNGIWNGDTVVDPAYVQLTTDYSPTQLETGEANNQYGYHWWVTDNKGLRIFYARGIKGQYVFVIPQKNLVIARLGRKRDEKVKLNGVPSDALKYIDMGLRIEAANAK